MLTFKSADPKQALQSKVLTSNWHRDAEWYKTRSGWEPSRSQQMEAWLALVTGLICKWIDISLYMLYQQYMFSYPFLIVYWKMWMPLRALLSEYFIGSVSLYHTWQLRTWSTIFFPICVSLALNGSLRRTGMSVLGGSWCTDSVASDIF